MVKTSPNTVEKDLDWSSFPSLPADFPPNTFEAAIKATKTSKPDVYTVDLKRDWCIGLVPQGGYTTSILTSALSIYMSTTHPTLNQTHPITIHAEFLARTAVGPALVRITPLKLGRQFSTLRVQLLQPPSTQNPKICIEAIVMQGNLSSPFSNLHLATRPRVEKVPRREDFEEGVVQEQWLGLRPALFKFEKRFPNGANVYGVSEGLGKSVREQWVSWGGGRKFGVQALGFLADAWRPIPEAYGLMGMWYPTVNYGIDIKRAGEWEWLFVRVEMFEAEGGRFGMDVWIGDEEGCVATSRHVCLIVGAERNTKGRAEGKLGSKI